MSEPLAAGTAVSATALGVAVEDHVLESTRILRGELGAPHTAPLPEFPDAGPGTTPLTRAVAHLSGLSVELSPHGWRLTGHRAGDDAAARSARSAHRSLLALTADVLGESAPGPTALRVMGPATLMASLALPNGEPVLSDPGAVRDVAQAWSFGMAELAAGVEASLPGAASVVHVHEPLLEQVTGGQVRSSSGFRELPAWDQASVGAAWQALAALVPTWLPRSAGASSETVPQASAILFDEAGPVPGDWEPIAAWVEGGGRVVLRLRREGDTSVAQRALRIAQPWRSLGLSAASLGQLIVEAGPDQALGASGLRRSAMAARDVADALDVVRHDDLAGLR